MCQIPWGQKQTPSNPSDDWTKKQKKLHNDLRQFRKLQMNQNGAGTLVQEGNTQSFTD